MQCNVSESDLRSRGTESGHGSDNGASQVQDRGRHLDNRGSNGFKSAPMGEEWELQGEQQEQQDLSRAAAARCSSRQERDAVDGVDPQGHGRDGPVEKAVWDAQNESATVTDAPQDPRQAKKKHRRRPSKKKRHWKPYCKLSWEERRALDERQGARASRVRAEMFAKGLPVAPYNTTQFIMEEHDREEPDLNTISEDEPLDCKDEDEDDDGSGEGSDGIGGPGGRDFLQRDFSETYEKYHVESLQNMSKQELVREYLELERCMSRLEEENRRLRLAMDSERIGELESELKTLMAQNEALRMQSSTKCSLVNPE